MTPKELTWEDVNTIIQIEHSMLTYTAWDSIAYPSDEEFCKEILRKYNKLKGDKNNGM